jgi:hypothetical protein
MEEKIWPARREGVAWTRCRPLYRLAWTGRSERPFGGRARAEHRALPVAARRGQWLERCGAVEAVRVGRGHQQGELVGLACPDAAIRVGLVTRREATTQAAQRGRRGGARAESGGPASKGAHHKRPVVAANGRCGQWLIGALLARDSWRRRERASRDAVPDWGKESARQVGLVREGCRWCVGRVGFVGKQ